MINLIIGIVTIIGYLYLSWRTLRDNYQEEDIIAFSWVVLLLFLVGGRLAYGFWQLYRDWETDRKSTRLNSSHSAKSRMPSSA